MNQTVSSISIQLWNSWQAPLLTITAASTCEVNNCVWTWAHISLCLRCLAQSQTRKSCITPNGPNEDGLSRSGWEQNSGPLEDWHVRTHNGWHCSWRGHVTGVGGWLQRFVHEGKSVGSLEDETKFWCICLNVFIWGRRTKHPCGCAHTLAAREPERWFYRLTALWPDTKWFPAPSSVCCQFSCPSGLPCPPSSRLDFMKHKTPGQLLMTPDISLSSRMTLISHRKTLTSHTGNNTRPVYPQEKLLSLPIPWATNMSDHWKAIGSASWAFLKTGSHKLWDGMARAWFSYSCKLNLLGSGTKKSDWRQ